jgi:hypothetical protein
VNTFHLSIRISPSPSLFALHPYLTPTRHIPYFPPDFYSTPSCHFWDLSLIFYFTRAPYYPDFRPTFLSTSPELRSATASGRPSTQGSTCLLHLSSSISHKATLSPKSASAGIAQSAYLLKAISSSPRRD